MNASGPYRPADKHELARRCMTAALAICQDAIDAAERAGVLERPDFDHDVLVQALDAAFKDAQEVELTRACVSFIRAELENSLIKERDDVQLGDIHAVAGLPDMMPPPDDHLDQTALRSVIDTALRGIDTQAARILRLRFAFDRDRHLLLREIAAELGLEYQRATALEHAALQHLRLPGTLDLLRAHFEGNDGCDAYAVRRLMPVRHKDVPLSEKERAEAAPKDTDRPLVVHSLRRATIYRDLPPDFGLENRATG